MAAFADPAQDVAKDLEAEAVCDNARGAVGGATAARAMDPKAALVSNLRNHPRS